ncbi:MAG: DMT family transporter [Burkholderiaceae bacterium]|nr:DMT family transporter [Burkholderiaceae bacterium]
MFPAGHDIISPDSRRRQWQALVACIAIVAVWGANFSVQKVVFEAVSPAGFLFVRYLIMPACALALLVHVYGLRFPSVPRADLLALARLGFFGHVLHVGSVTYGIHWSTAFSSSLILACGPVFTLLILRCSGIERMTRAQVAGAAIACGGVLVFLSDKLAAGSWSAGIGDLVLLVSASFFSYYTVASKPLIERHGGVVVMAYATLLGAAPIVLLTAPAGLRVDWTGFGPGIWLGLLFAIVVSAFVGWLVWGWVNAVRGVARTAPMMYGMPPVAGLISWIAVGEAFTATKVAGAMIALGGVALAQFAGNASLPAAFRMRLPSVRSAASRR